MSKEISFQTSELVEGKTQVYLEEISDTRITEIFDKSENEYVFRHRDCPVVFTTDGSFIYSEDMDELGVDPVAKYGLDGIMHVYNNFQDFLDTFRAIEDVLGRELYLSDWYNMKDHSIRSLELSFAKTKKRKTSSFK